jgi:ABC-type sugar transport system substrate-binding protein
MTAPISDSHSDLYVSFVGENPYDLGHIAGEAVVKALKETGQDGGKVAILAGSMVEGVAPIRAAAFKDAIKVNPKIELVSVEDAKWSTELSEKAAGQLYARFASQGGLAAIYGMADNQAIAAIQAANAAYIPVGVAKGKLIVVGSNCLGNSVQLVKEGKMYSSASQWPERTGVAAAELIAGMFNGKAPPKRLNLPVEMITKDNADKWIGPCTY